MSLLPLLLRTEYAGRNSHCGCCGGLGIDPYGRRCRIYCRACFLLDC
jgi:hypothetical protein